MNKWIGIGRLTKDPEINTTQNGKAVCKFTLAVNRPYKDESGDNQADFLPIIVWDKLADNCCRYLSKGKQCAVTGRIQTRSYEAQDGSKRYVTEIIANEVEFLSPKAEGEEKPPRIEDLPEINDDTGPLPF